MGQAILAVAGLYALKILWAVVIFFVGRFLAKLAKRVTLFALKRGNTDEMIQKFVASLVYFGVMIFVVIAVLAKLDINTLSLSVVIGAAGLAIGLALQGSLSNFAAGFLIVILRPFRVGDYLECAGVTGSVQEIQIFNTILLTPDNKQVIVPNGKLIGDNITNYSAQESRRVDLVIGVSYKEDLKRVRAVIEEVLATDDRILKDPAPTVAVLELADNSVNFVVRPWTATANYWGVYFDMTEAIKIRFDAEGIEIPFPQRDVHTYSEA